MWYLVPAWSTCRLLSLTRLFLFTIKTISNLRNIQPKIFHIAFDEFHIICNQSRYSYEFKTARGDAFSRSMSVINTRWAFLWPPSILFNLRTFYFIFIVWWCGKDHGSKVNSNNIIICEDNSTSWNRRRCRTVIVTPSIVYILPPLTVK